MLTALRIVTSIVLLASLAYVVLVTMSAMLLDDGTKRIQHVRFWLPVGGLSGMVVGGVLGLFGTFRSRDVVLGLTLSIFMLALIAFNWWFRVVYKGIHAQRFGFKEDEFDAQAANLAIAILALMPPVGYVVAVYAPWFALLLAPLLAIATVKWTLEVQ